MSYIRDRAIQAAVTLYAIVTLAFFLNKLMPGGPIEYLRTDMRANPSKYGLPRNPSDQMINQMIDQLVNIPPEQPLHEAYIGYLNDVFLEFKFGESYIVSAGTPVSELIVNYAPWTIFLSSISMIYGLVVGIVLGAFMAYYEGTKFDIGMTVGMTIDSGIPFYVAAIFLLYVFGFQLGWFPSGGRADPNTTPGMNIDWVVGVFYYASLPALSFILTGFGGRALGLRANSIRLLGSDYVKEAELRGLSTYRIAVTYLARNAILPIWTSVVISLGALLGGSVILEQIFQYPGMGLLMFEAAVGRDFPVLMGTFVLVTVMFVIGTLLADFTYPLIDPRADVKETRG